MADTDTGYLNAAQQIYQLMIAAHTIAQEAQMGDTAGALLNVIADQDLDSLAIQAGAVTKDTVICLCEAETYFCHKHPELTGRS